MFRTIIIGSCVSVQGIFVKHLPNGRMSVRVGAMVYEGIPIVPMKKQ